MTIAWALWSTNVGVYQHYELIQVFADLETAETVRDNLFGKPVSRTTRSWVWEDDEDLPDLLVRPIAIR